MTLVKRQVSHRNIHFASWWILQGIRSSRLWKGNLPSRPRKTEPNESNHVSQQKKNPLTKE